MATLLYTTKPPMNRQLRCIRTVLVTFTRVTLFKASASVEWSRTGQFRVAGWPGEPPPTSFFCRVFFRHRGEWGAWFNGSVLSFAGRFQMNSPNLYWKVRPAGAHLLPVVSVSDTGRCGSKMVRSPPLPEQYLLGCGQLLSQP
jgi:hypothetical protein